MSLATRIIPVLLHKGRTLYKGEKFNPWRSVGHAAQAVKIHQARGVDELILLDVSATKEKRRPDFKMIEDLSSDCFSPLTVGGGIRTLDDVKCTLDVGADKVAICTEAMFNPAILRNVSDHYGSQAVVAVLEVTNGKVTCGATTWMNDPVQMAKIFEDNGAGEILLSCVERDGMMQGYDLDMIRAVSQAISIPVIALGGAGTYHNLHEAIQAGASAVAAGAMWLFSDCTPKGAAQYLHEQGVEVRL